MIYYVNEGRNEQMLPKIKSRVPTPITPVGAMTRGIPLDYIAILGFSPFGVADKSRGACSTSIGAR